MDKATIMSCARICHEEYMRITHYEDHEDPQDDYELTMQADVAKKLRDKIKKLADDCEGEA